MIRLRRPIGTLPLFVALAVVVLTPAAGVLWFMKEAMGNQQLASRQRLAEAYRKHLALVRDRLDSRQERQAAALDGEATILGADALFKRALQVADSAICYGADGERSYPAPPKIDVPDSSPAWTAARQLEDTGALTEAANAYAAIGGPSAVQAEARCLARAGKRERAVALVVSRPDALPEVLLFALDLMDPGDRRRSAVARRLESRLMDYDIPLPGGERLFLMHEMQRLKLIEKPFPTLGAEELAAQVSESANVAGVWKLWSPQKRVLLLFDRNGVASRIRFLLKEQTTLSGVTLTATGPGERAPVDSLELSRFPGWRVGMAVTSDESAGEVENQRTLWYLWIGCIAIAGTSIAAVLVAQTVRRQVRLAGVKADLAATVSHELRTPVSSMRLLVETLLDKPEMDPVQTREYLEIIARENQRLSHLIEQFLTFSRMERKKHVFAFAEVRPEQVARRAVDAMGERLDGCSFREEIAPNLPSIQADEPSLVTAIVNLLDNACKYSTADKQIALRVSAGKGRVRFSVEDHGIGIEPRETGRIFRKFYQTDQALARKVGGVGLGLSIVRLVVEAHHGAVEVESHPGKGSTFTISLAAA